MIVIEVALLVSVRKHPAPEGALRLAGRHLIVSRSPVRKHPAPEGALRHETQRPTMIDLGQKAPRTRRCIKTKG